MMSFGGKWISHFAGGILIGGGAGRRIKNYKMFIFDNIPHTDRKLKNYSEPEYSYLNRSGRPLFSRVRNLLENWFSRYPEKSKQDLKARFISPDDRQHYSAFFELYMHELMNRIGFSVSVHPEIDNLSTHPDFLLSINNGSRFFLEATLVTKSSAEYAAEKRINTVYDSIDKLSSPNFYLGVKVQGFPDSPPNGRKWRNDIRKWLSTLNPDDIEHIKHSPSIELKHDGWQVVFEAIPKPPFSRGKKGVRPIASHFINFKKLTIVEQIRKSISDKTSKYGTLNYPYLIAVNVHNMFFFEDMIMDVLFGDEGFSFSLQSSETKLVRAQNGIFNKPEGHRNRRISGVIFFNCLTCYGITKTSPLLFHNPWANIHFDKELWPFRQVIVEPNEKKQRIEIWDFFELPQYWPTSS